MNLHSTILAVGITGLLGGCAATSQQQRAENHIASAQCASLPESDRDAANLYEPGRVTRVEPLVKKEFLARAIQREYTAGARLYLPAQRGMTQPYLERALVCHTASQAALHPNDPLRVQNLKSVSVATSGHSFVVTIAGADKAAGKEIWQRASAITNGSGQVDVRQLSAAPAKNQF
jgi:hypothetical protein